MKVNAGIFRKEDKKWKYKKKVQKPAFYQSDHFYFYSSGQNDRCQNVSKTLDNEGSGGVFFQVKK